MVLEPRVFSRPGGPRRRAGFTLTESLLAVLIHPGKDKKKEKQPQNPPAGRKTKEDPKTAIRHFAIPPIGGPFAVILFLQQFA